MVYRHLHRRGFDEGVESCHHCLKLFVHQIALFPCVEKFQRLAHRQLFGLECWLRRA